MWACANRIDEPHLLQTVRSFDVAPIWVSAHAQMLEQACARNGRPSILCAFIRDRIFRYSRTVTRLLSEIQREFRADHKFGDAPCRRRVPDHPIET